MNVPLFLIIDETVEWCLLYDHYKDQLVDQAMLMLTLTGRVTETNQVLATQFRFRLCTSNLVIKVSLKDFSVLNSK